MPVSESGLVVRIASRGDGVTADGRHASYAAPGDLVDADGAIVPGPEHRAPPCVHFPECGGCRLQHVSDKAFADFLADRILWALRAQGISAPAMRTPILSPPMSRRRAVLAWQDGRLGFNAEGSHRIVDMRECHILRPELFALVAPLRALMHRLGRPSRRASVSLTFIDQGVDLLIQGVSPDGLQAAEMLSDFAGRHGLARFSTEDGSGPETQWEPEPATVTLGGAPVPFPHGAFLQATADGEAALVDCVREIVGDATAAADLFAGLGTFAFAVESIKFAAEGARDVVQALQSGAARAGRAIEVSHRDLFRRPLDAAEVSRFDAVVIDPPRAGAKEQVAALASSELARIAMISCNSSTFARDAKMLVDGGYRLDWVQPVGQFRWSTHVELAASFSRV